MTAGLPFWRTYLVVLGIILLTVLALQLAGQPGGGTSGRYEFVEPGCAEMPAMCETPV